MRMGSQGRGLDLLLPFKTPLGVADPIESDPGCSQIPSAGELHTGTRETWASLELFSLRFTEIELRGRREKSQILHRELAKR